MEAADTTSSPARRTPAPCPGATTAALILAVCCLLCFSATADQSFADAGTPAGTRSSETGLPVATSRPGSTEKNAPQPDPQASLDDEDVEEDCS